MVPSRATFLIPALIGALAGDALAQRAGHHHRVSPAVERWFAHDGYRRFQGRHMANGPDPRHVPVTIRVARVDDVARLAQLDGADVALTRNGRELSRLGPIVSATVTRAGLARLVAEPSVRRVELDVVPPFDPPLDVTARQIGATDVWATVDGAGAAVTGNGVVIADIDSGVDVLHPLMFRATHAYYPWSDRDANGAFTPGVDAIELGDGTTPPLDYFEGAAYTLFESVAPILGTGDGEFDAGMDHLYVDANGNGVRDFGPAAGFSERDPTYGELLVLVDDVDGDGELDVDEKLVALGPSKVRAYYDAATEYTRGVDLIAAPGHDDPWAFHGAGVTGILAGGNRGLTRLVGVAPDAELLVGAFQTADALSPLMTWAVQQDADVILHEYAPWVGYHRDGSSNHELMMDAASAAGAVNVNPSGNLGGARKHARVDVAAGGAATVPIDVPSGGYHYAQLTVHWRQPDRELELVLEAPGGDSANLGSAGADTTIGAVSVHAFRDDSARGTAMFDIVVWTDTGSLPKGEWTLAVADNGAAAPEAPAAELSLYVADDVSGWGRGVEFADFVSEQHLIGFPATADSAITVAAYAGHGEPPYDSGAETTGQLRRYSCRGTRIDGAEIMDITAPDNPLSAINAVDFGGGYSYPHGSYIVFGGTSGAGPHVAGTAALVKQLHPEWTGEQVRDAIRAGALVDADVTGDGTLTASQLWGAGKLRTYRALYGEAAPANTPPAISATVTHATAGEPAALSIDASDAEDATADLRVELDADYDGSYELGPARPASLPPVTFPEPGPVIVKARVTDSGGLSAAALLRVEVAEACAECEPTPDPGDGAGCGCRTGQRSGPGALLALLAALGALARRRRTTAR